MSAEAQTRTNKAEITVLLHENSEAWSTKKNQMCSFKKINLKKKMLQHKKICSKNENAKICKKLQNDRAVSVQFQCSFSAVSEQFSRLANDQMWEIRNRNRYLIEDNLIFNLYTIMLNLIRFFLNLN